MSYFLAMALIVLCHGPEAWAGPSPRHGIDTFIKPDFHAMFTVDGPHGGGPPAGKAGDYVETQHDTAIVAPPLRLTAAGRVLRFIQSASDAPTPVFRDGTLPLHDVTTGSETAQFGAAYERSSPIGNSIIAPRGNGW